jgi:proton-coupled amino acid transporter
MKNKEDYSKVVVVGLTIVCLILISFGLCAYFCFKDTTQPAILSNLDLTQWYIQLIILLLIFSIIVVYPVIINPAFKILETMVIRCHTKRDLWINILRACVVTFTILMGIISIGKFDKILSLVGSGVSTPIALILPALFHYKLYKDKQPLWRNILDLTITCIGFTVVFSVFTFTLINFGK